MNKKEFSDLIFENIFPIKIRFEYIIESENAISVPKIRIGNDNFLKNTENRIRNELIQSCEKIETDQAFDGISYKVPDGWYDLLLKIGFIYPKKQNTCASRPLWSITLKIQNQNEFIRMYNKIENFNKFVSTQKIKTFKDLLK
jgi:hypothetical protein